MQTEKFGASIKVSVIVPVYNVESYLRKCLDSLVHQTLDEIQIIVVNDGSPDGSQGIIEEYVHQYPQKVMGLIKQNGGLSDARNFGIPYAQGEYIGFVDSDDYLDLTMYEKMYNKAVESDSDIVTCGYYGVNEQTDDYRYFQKGNMIQYGLSLWENPKLLYTNAPYAWNKIYRRSLFLDTGIRFPKGKIYEDIATIYPLMLHANRISKVDEALYYYILQREGAITATFSDKILQMYDSLAVMNEHYIKAGAFESFEDVLGFINLKHTILRFRDFTSYTNRNLQFRMIRQGFKHLDHYFRNWRGNETFFNFYFSKKKWMRFFSKYKITWYMYSLMPNTLVRFGDRIGKFVKKALWAFTKRSYLNKYRYVRKCRTKKVVENQVLFESFHGTNLNDSPFAMMCELAKDGDFKIYYTSKTELLKKHRKMLDAYGLKQVTLVPLGSKKYQDVLATSKYLVNNVSFPPYFIRREEQIYLNTWHGTPLKTLGKKMVKGIQDMSNIQRNFLQSSYLLHPNRYTMDNMMEDYNLNHLYTGKVILSGYPRNAVFWDRQSEKAIREKYGFSDKEAFAYMPTWRGATSQGANSGGYEQEVQAILQKLDETLTDRQIMYVNLHPLVKDKVSIEGFRHITVFPEDMDSYAFLNAVDVLITDYSSVFFDYSITRKPIALFMYDYDEYMAERGMYMDVRSLPFEKLYSIQDMQRYLSRPDKAADLEGEAYRKYYESFIGFDAPDSIQKINNLIFYGKSSDLEVMDYAENSCVPRTLYLADKIKHTNNYEKLEALKTLENPVAVFLRKDFTSHTLEVLSREYDRGLDYLVIDTHMFLSVTENIHLFISREKKRYDCADLYKTELRRILPGIPVKRVVVGADMYRNNSIQYAVERENSDSERE